MDELREVLKDFSREMEEREVDERNDDESTVGDANEKSIREVLERDLRDLMGGKGG